MVNSYDDLMGTATDPEEHDAHNMPQATEHYAGDVIPLHPAGTFSHNTNVGDTINSIAKALGTKPPDNVIKFPKK